MNWASGLEAVSLKKDRHWKGDFQLKRYRFGILGDCAYVEEVPFRPIAAIWTVLEHLYSEIAAEPPFHRGPLHSTVVHML
jgi:hypothetical protein